MTTAERSMMQRIHALGRLLALNEENTRRVRKLIDELLENEPNIVEARHEPHSCPNNLD